jgi:hypothetical protein
MLTDTMNVDNVLILIRISLNNMLTTKLVHVHLLYECLKIVQHIKSCKVEILFLEFLICRLNITKIIIKK